MGHNKIGFLTLALLGTVALAGCGGGTSATYKATVIAHTAPDPASLKMTVRVTNTSNAAGTPSCTLTASDPSGADSGVDVATLKKPLGPGKSAVFGDTIVITHQGARHVTKMSVTCN